MKSVKSQFEYDYDFGDGWHHRIVVQVISKVPEGYKVVTKCLDGKRRCPPEDVGGTQGFAEFLDACEDPKHPEHKRYQRWADGSFDPKDFDPELVNLELFKYARWSRPRANDDELEVDE